MMVAPMGMAGKPQPPPYNEPTGILKTTSSPELAVLFEGYVRLYDWVNGKFIHTWSGVTGFTNPSSVFIGDVDNDGFKEIIAGGAFRSDKIKGQISFTSKSFVWRYGDASNAPSYTSDTGPIPYGGGEIGDVNGDNVKEYVCGKNIWTCDANGFHLSARLDINPSGGITIADADNDGKNEILYGFGPNYGHGFVVKFKDGAYSVVGDLGPANTQGAIDQLSVGDLDGVAGNEIFGSGYCNGNIYIWQYSQATGKYNQIWTAQRNPYFDQNNAIADINGDGKNEFAFTEYAPASNLVIYQYPGNNVWTQLGSYSPCDGNWVDEMFPCNLDADKASELIVQDSVWDWDGSTMKQIQDLGVSFIVSFA